MAILTSESSDDGLTLVLRLPFTGTVAAALCAGGLIFIASLIYFLQPSAAEREAYSSLNHLALNVVPPKTEWLNMGWWLPEEEGGSERTFPEACEALATRLHAMVELRPGSRVLDVGCASGDGLLLLLREQKELGVIHGVTSLEAHAQRARHRLAAAVSQLSASTDHQVKHAVYTDDAVAFLASGSESSGDATVYDYIFALDCAYHFNTRADFLQKAYARLAPGGSVVLMDLVASQDIDSVAKWTHTAQMPSTTTAVPVSVDFRPSELAPRTRIPPLLRRLRYRILLRLAGVPHYNMVTLPTYVRTLHSLGYRSIKVQDISHAMFPGFSRFLHSLGVCTTSPADTSSLHDLTQQQVWRGPLAYWTWWPLREFGDVVARWGRGGEEGDVRSIYVVATKPA